MTTPTIALKPYIEMKTAESPKPNRHSRDLPGTGNGRHNIPFPLHTPLTYSRLLTTRTVSVSEKKTPPTIRLGDFIDISLSNSLSAVSLTDDQSTPQTPSPKKASPFPCPQTGVPSPDAKIRTRPIRSYSPARRLFVEGSNSSSPTTRETVKTPSVVGPQKPHDPTFMALANYFVSGIPTIEASLRAHRLSTGMDPFLAENPNDAVALATKALALIVRGEVADFVEVFHRTDQDSVRNVVEILMEVLTRAEKAHDRNQKNLIALVIKTGCLGLKGQYEQTMSTDSYSAAPEDLGADESSPSQTAQMQSLYLESVHEETLASAEELLALEPDHLTATLMKIQALTFLGKTDKVLEMLTSALKAHPDNAIIWTLFARFYYDENPKQALEAVTIAIAKDSKQFLSHAIRLQLLSKLNDAIGFLKAKNETEEFLSSSHPLIFDIVLET